jgi:phage shock protein C
MTDRTNRTTFAVLAGLGLVMLGGWLLLGGVFGPLFEPLRWLFSAVARIAWPVLLIIVGVLLIMRARGAGWQTSGKPWRRSRSNRLVGGVLGGLADVLNVDATLLRVAYAVFTLMTWGWFGIILYMAAMIFIPEDSVVASWNAGSDGRPTPPPAPPVPPMPSNAPTPPPSPTPPSSSTEPPQAPPVPQPPTVL